MTGEFGRKESVIRALQELKSDGVAAEDLDVFSDVPLEIPRSVLNRGSHMSLAVVLGAIAFFVLAVGLVYFTQHNYEIVTGGMPVFSFWATGVVFFELTMLGAILTSLCWFIYESGVVWKRRPARPAFQTGSICLMVQCEATREDSVRRLLERAGAIKFRGSGELE